MNKKLSIFALVLIIVGLVGSILSGLYSMPYFVNKVNEFEYKENIIYEKKIDIEALDINTNYVNVDIVKGDSDKIIIKTKGIYENVDIKVTDNNKVLNIKEVDKDISMRKIKNIDDFTSNTLANIFNNYANMITIYIPNNVDVKVTSKGGILSVENDIFLDDFSYETLDGQLVLPDGVKNLQKLNIASKDYINLQLGEILGIKEVDIYGNEVYIRSDKYNLNDIEKDLPDKININSNGTDSNIIDIESNSPISKNLNINGYELDVNLNLPLGMYKFNFDLNSYENIHLNEFLQKDFNNQDNDLKDFKRVINKDMKDEYKVNIQAENIYFN